MSQPSSSFADSGYGSQPDPYKQKLKDLKASAKDLIFINAALCDQVSDTQERLVIAKERRRFLTEKLYQIRAQLEQDNQLQTNKPIQQLVVSPQQLFTSSFEEENGRRVSVNYPQYVTDDESNKPTKKKSKPKKPTASAGPSKGKKTAESIPQRAQQSLLTHSYVKQELEETREPPPQYPSAGKTNTRNIPVDPRGLPEYPIFLADLTIYSLGNFDYNDSYEEENCNPVGYCAARVYVSMTDMYSKCTYFCKVLDNGDAPRYVIDYEDYENKKIPLVGKTPNECVAKLIHYVNKVIGFQIVKPARNLGEKFFGLSHPAVKDLIRLLLQSDTRPDAKYGLTIALGPDETVDETLNFDALQNKIAYYNFDFENMDVAEEVLDAY